jgi:hypothetical protein
MCGGVEEKTKQKMNDACCALYITTLVAGVLELETNVLYVLDPMVRCICTAIMVAIPLFPIHILYMSHPDSYRMYQVVAQQKIDFSRIALAAEIKMVII